MKRLIFANNYSTESYDDKSPKWVTRQYILKCFKNLSNAEIAVIIDGIMKWKSDAELCYHHADLDTNNNDPSNILLITNDAHSTLHHISYVLKFFRHYDLVLPGYSQGLLAKRATQTMYTNLYEDLGGAHLYDVMQLIVPIQKYLARVGDSAYTSQDIYNCLPSRLYYITKDQIEAIITYSDVNFEQAPRAIYIDQETYDEIYPQLEALRDKHGKTSYTYRSLQSILDFMDNNTLSRSEIYNYYKQHRLKR